MCCATWRALLAARSATAYGVLSQLEAVQAAVAGGAASLPLHESVGQLQAATGALMGVLVDAATRRFKERRGSMQPLFCKLCGVCALSVQQPCALPDQQLIRWFTLAPLASPRLLPATLQGMPVWEHGEAQHAGPHYSAELPRLPESQGQAPSGEASGASYRGGRAGGASACCGRAGSASSGRAGCSCHWHWRSGRGDLLCSRSSARGH